jgi:hypothetical protein
MNASRTAAATHDGAEESRIRRQLHHLARLPSITPRQATFAQGRDISD